MHESGLRKCLDFVFFLGVDLGCFLSPFGVPLEALGETLGRPWGLFGVLLETLAAMGCSGMPLGSILADFVIFVCLWGSILKDFWIFVALWVQKLVQDVKKYDFAMLLDRDLWRISGESLGNPFRMLMESWGNLEEPLGNLWGKFRKSCQNSHGILGGSLGSFGESLGKARNFCQNAY